MTNLLPQRRLTNHAAAREGMAGGFYTLNRTSLLLLFCHNNDGRQLLINKLTQLLELFYKVIQLPELTNGYIVSHSLEVLQRVGKTE